MNKIFASIIVFMMAFQVHAQSLYFPPVVGTTWDTLSPKSLGYCQSNIDSLYAFLDTNNTKAFILLKDGKIVLEKYFGSHTQSTPWQWASAGKSLTAFMVGVAQQEGFLSINDTTSKYLGQGWTVCTQAQEDKITIRHQLTMTTGLDDGVPDHYCTLDSCLIYKADAGTRWAYHNGPYTLLDSVIESATGISLNSYTTQKLKNPIGMSGVFIPVDYNNVFFSNARSMARFGLLMLNKGNWNGNQIMTDTAYFNQMTNTSQMLNKSYGYLWWLNGKPSFMLPSSQIVFSRTLIPNAPADMISAMGKGGQFLNVIPSLNMVWVRMGDEPANSLVPFLLNDDIWRYVNELDCNSTAVDNQLHSSPVVQLYPNPAQGMVRLKSNLPITKVEICNLQGQVIQSVLAQDTDLSMPINLLHNGFYFVKATLADGTIWTDKLLVE